jgi:phage terminase large subunit-like protein
LRSRPMIRVARSGRETLDFVWFDEEPPQDVYIEGLTRTNATGGMVYLTFTPLKGISDVVHSFIQECGQA